MHASGSDREAHELEALERDLRRNLYRFDCPEPSTLGEYQLDLLPEQQRVAVATHAAECDECLGELQMLRKFIAAPISLPGSIVDRARRIVATLFVAPPGAAYSRLRGSTDSPARIYEAGDITVTVGPGQTGGSLIGLVVTADQGPESLAGSVVRLIPRQGEPTVTDLDDLGNFELGGLSPGHYALEIELPVGVVVVEELHVN